MPSRRCEHVPIFYKANVSVETLARYLRLRGCHQSGTKMIELPRHQKQEDILQVFAASIQSDISVTSDVFTS